MKLLCPPRTLRYILRHQMSGVQKVLRSENARGSNATSSSTSLPDEINKRLRTLKSDVVASVLDPIPLCSDQATNSPHAFVPAFTGLHTGNLQEMAKYYFNQGGKLLRPRVCLLMASACNQIVTSADRCPSTTTTATASKDAKMEQIELNQYRIAMVSEMIHTASLVHDDVIDESNLRRGNPTANARWGNRQAVLVGDFILARSTKVLCSIGDPKVIAIMAAILEDLVRGELMQFNSVHYSDNEGPVDRFQHYMRWIFYKTASLFANSCLSVSTLAGNPFEFYHEATEKTTIALGCDDIMRSEAFEFGKSLGLAFQLIDDILDGADSTGKPKHQDLRQGLATCPVIFAAEEYPELNAFMDRRLSEPEDIIRASEIVQNSNGIRRTRELAKHHCDAAIQIARRLPNGSGVRDCLLEAISTQLERKA